MSPQEDATHALGFYAKDGAGPFLYSDKHPKRNSQLQWVFGTEFQFLENVVPHLPADIRHILMRLLSIQHEFSRLHYISDLTYLVLQDVGLIALNRIYENGGATDRIESLVARLGNKPTHGIWYELIHLCALEGDFKNGFGCLGAIGRMVGLASKGQKLNLISVDFPYFDKFGNEQTRRINDTPLSLLVTFRNKYLGHGVSFDEQQSLEIWWRYRPVLIAFLQQLIFFKDTVADRHQIELGRSSKSKVLRIPRKLPPVDVSDERIYRCGSSHCQANREQWAFIAFQKCPCCRESLIIADALKTANWKIENIKRLPYVVAYPLSRLKHEHDPYRGLHLAKDAFSNFLKYLGLLVFSEYLTSDLQLQKFSKLYEGYLLRPQIGHWNAFIREGIEVLEDAAHQWHIPELPIAFSNSLVSVDTENRSLIDRLIHMRNQVLGHGFVPTARASHVSLNTFMHDFSSILNQFDFLQHYELLSGPLNKLSTKELSLMGIDPQFVATQLGLPSHPYIKLTSDRGYLELAPFFISPQLYFPKSISSKSTLMLYEQNTGKRVLYFGPESVIGETDGDALDALSMMLKKKQAMPALDPQKIDEATASELLAVHNQIQIDSLISAGNIFTDFSGQHVYEHRTEIEAELVAWSGSDQSTGVVFADPGAGKTNLLVSMVDRLSDCQHLPVLIRAKNCIGQSLSHYLSKQLNLGSQIGLHSFIEKFQDGGRFRKFVVLIDGLNEHHGPEQLFIEATDFAHQNSCKCLFSCREAIKLREKLFDIAYPAKPKTFRLELLDLQDLERIWERYTKPQQNSKTPLFRINSSLEEIYYNQPLIYQSLKNPLHLRLFLEACNGKSLPKKSKRLLSVWSEYDNTLIGI